MSRCEQENPEISRCLAMPLHFCNDFCTPGKQAVAVGARGTLTGHSQTKMHGWTVRLRCFTVQIKWNNSSVWAMPR